MATRAEKEEIVYLKFSELFPFTITDIEGDNPERTASPRIPSMWTRIGNPLEEFPEWVQPIGTHDAYSKGAKTSHSGKKWVSEVDGNTWEPGIYGWTEYSGPEPQKAPQEAQDGPSEEPGNLPQQAL